MEITAMLASLYDLVAYYGDESDIPDKQKEKIKEVYDSVQPDKLINERLTEFRKKEST